MRRNLAPKRQPLLRRVTCTNTQGINAGTRLESITKVFKPSKANPNTFPTIDGRSIENSSQVSQMNYKSRRRAEQKSMTQNRGTLNKSQSLLVSKATSSTSTITTGEAGGTEGVVSSGLGGKLKYTKASPMTRQSDASVVQESKRAARTWGVESSALIDSLYNVTSGADNS